MAAERCPVIHGAGASGRNQVSEKPKTVRDWWPETLDLRLLHQDPISARPSHVPHPRSASVEGSSSPSAAAYASYAARLSSLDMNGLRNDIYKALTTSNPAWPSDYGTYGPLLIRLAWHASGTYRVFDGRGGGNSGNIRLAPLNSWPDNANLDKARRYILWPIKQKYGQAISWADLILLAGNVAIESMMGEWGTVEPLWFGFGRIDAFAPEEDVYWGHEHEWLEDSRHDKSKPAADDVTGLEHGLGAVQMGLIYVNPQGPGGNPDIMQSAKDIRTTFARMGMGDSETVALIAGGHTFGKAHGAADPDKYVAENPEGSPIEAMNVGWHNSFGTGKGKDTITSGLEGGWTKDPAKWDNGYFTNLFTYDWEQTKSPAGAIQWVPTKVSIDANGGMSSVSNVVDAHDSSKSHLPIMFTTDLALRFDEKYGPIAKNFHDNPVEFEDAWKRAWHKLLHRDMGPKSRHLGPYSVTEELIWMDPIPTIDYATVSSNDVRVLKDKILDAVNRAQISIPDLVKASWASASTYRCTDHRGGANGGRIRLEPQRSWPANDPESLAKVIAALELIQLQFNRAATAKQVSFADMVILGGCAAIEEAARRAGHIVRVPFVAGRADSSQEQTDVASFGVLEPQMDGFRNYNSSSDTRPERGLVDRAHLLTLTAPEMCVLIGGLRVLGANADNSSVGVLTDRPGVLSTDFFASVCDDSITWNPMSCGKLFQGSRPAGKPFTASRTDLILGSNSQLRAICESYASADSTEPFLRDFVSAWSKVMMLDRFDLLQPNHTSSEYTTVLYYAKTVSKL